MAGSYWGRGTHCHPTSLLLPWKPLIGCSNPKSYHLVYSNITPNAKGSRLLILALLMIFLYFLILIYLQSILLKNPLKNLNISLDCIKPSKSEVFCSSISDSSKKQILEVLQYKEGSRLVRYLGMPLIPGKFSF